MENFPSNSHESKEKRIVKPVVTGAKTKKKSEISKVADVFLAEDINSVKSYIIMDVLVPAVKKAISDIVTNGIDMILYGGNGNPSTKKSIASKVSYTPYYKYNQQTNQTNDRPVSRPKAAYEYDDVVFDSRGEAEKLLLAMDHAIQEYGMVSVGDYYDLAGITSQYTTHKYGWTDLRGAEVVRIREGYIIKLPKPTPLD